LISPESPAAETPPAPVPLAGPWQRYWARMFDFVVEAVLVGILAGIFWPSIFEAGELGDRHPMLVSWLVCPAVMLVDAVIYALFGTTAGKAVTGIVVRTERDSRRLPFWLYTKRNLELFIFGFGAFFAIIPLLTQVHNYLRLKRGDLTFWDFSCDSRVIVRSARPLRTWSAALTTLLLYASMLGLSYRGGQQETQEQVRAATPEEILNAPAGKSFTTSPQTEQELSALAAQANATAPEMVSSEIRFDHARVESPQMLVYEYTAVNRRKSEMTSDELAEFQRNARQEFYEATCVKMQYGTVLKVAAALKLEYSDHDGAPLVTAALAQSDCGSVVPPASSAQ
jgi:RDD family